MIVNPLNDTHCDCLNKVLESTAYLAKLIGDCKDCGIDMGPADELNTIQRETATALKAKFFPNRS